MLLGERWAGGQILPSLGLFSANHLLACSRVLQENSKGSSRNYFNG